MTVVEYIVGFLATNGIRVCYGIPGGSAEALIDAIGRLRDRFRFVLSRHETAACFQASAHWCFSHEIAAVVTTSGAGLFNAFNGVYEAFASRVPMLIIAGAIPRAHELTSNFQNTSGMCASPNAIAAFSTTTVFTRSLERPEDLPFLLAAALRATHAPRRGPALLLVPKDLQHAELDSPSPRPIERRPVDQTGDVVSLAGEIRRAARPLAIVGEGVKRHGARTSLVDLVERTGLAVVATAGGKDSFPWDHERFFGLIGIFGQPRALQAALRADLLVFIGAMEEPFSCYGVPLEGRRRASIQEGDGGWLASPYSFSGDLAHALSKLGDALASYRSPFTPDDGPPAIPSPLVHANGPSLHTNSAVKRIGDVLPDECNILYDCGLVAAAAIQYLPARLRSQHEFSLSSAAMGYAVAGGIGAAIAYPGRRTVVLTGDGSLLMNGTELHTAVAEHLDVLFIVMNNGGHGIGRIAQQLFHEGRLTGTSFPRVDCCAFARALGAQHAEPVETLAELETALKRALELRGVRLIDVVIDVEACPPMLTFLDKAAGHGLGPIG